MAQPKAPSRLKMTEASFKIRFLVVGATAAGLASAITLRRAGHEVTLLEVEDQMAETWGMTGCIVPPNMSKLLIRWGLERELQDASVQSRTILMTHYERDEVLGQHSWHEELFKDAGGDCLYMHYADVRQLLYDKAISLGAVVVPQARISSIDFTKEDRPSIRLATGEVFEADVIVGTDGPESIVRRTVLGQDVKETNLGMTIFSVTVPRQPMEEDPELVSLLEASRTSHTWLGYSRGAIGHIAGVRPEYTMQFYIADSRLESLWYQDVSREQLLDAMGGCEPRLRKLVELSSQIRCVPFTEPPELETWVHSSGRMLIIGDAAHPFPRGSTNGVSTSVCDAGALGELFRHLHSEEQITSFLHAFENMRRDRVKAMLEADLANYTGVAMPPGEAHEMRDQAMREKHAAGGEALAGDEDDVVAAIWEREKEVFAYDAEDQAAEWWNDWGLLQERASNKVQFIKDKVPILEIQQTVAFGVGFS